MHRAVQVTGGDAPQRANQEAGRQPALHPGGAAPEAAPRRARVRARARDGRPLCVRTLVICTLLLTTRLLAPCPPVLATSICSASLRKNCVRSQSVPCCQRWLRMQQESHDKERQCIDVWCMLMQTALCSRHLLRVEGEAARRPERGSYARSTPAASPSRKRPKTLEERFMDEWRPPRIFPNRYVAVATALLALGLAWYSTLL